MAVEVAYLDCLGDYNTVALRDRFLNLYKHILRFQASAVVHLDGNTARRTGQHMFSTSSWANPAQQIRDADENCEEHRQLLDSCQSRENAVELRKLLLRFQSDVFYEWRLYRKMHEEWYETERASQCMKALRTLDYESHKNLVPAHAAGTCQWLISHAKFSDWIREGQFPCLWLTGDPECGKSVLSRYLVDVYLPHHCTPETTICYYFSKNESGRSSASNALCSILHQIFGSAETGFWLQHVKRSWESNRERLAELFDELWRVFVSVSSDCCVGEMIIVLDALDECAEADRKILLPKLAVLSTSTDGAASLKLLLTSRPDSFMVDALMRSSQGVRTVRLMGEDPIEADAIRNEIDTYVETCVSEFRELRKARFGYEDDAYLYIQTHLLSAPNRTYLWVALVFQVLKACVGKPVADIQEQVRTLPSTVEGHYEGILRTSNDEGRARKLLSLMLAAKDNLTPTELYMALQVTESAQNLTDLTPLPDAALSSYLRELCGLFITFGAASRREGLIRGVGRTALGVFLIHETAREFLSRPAIDSESCCPHLGWKHSITWQDACHEYARSCMLVLLLLVKHMSSRKSSNPQVSVAKSHISELGLVHVRSSSLHQRRIPVWKESFLSLM